MNRLESYLERKEKEYESAEEQCEIARTVTQNTIELRGMSDEEVRLYNLNETETYSEDSFRLKLNQIERCGRPMDDLFPIFKIYEALEEAFEQRGITKEAYDYVNNTDYRKLIVEMSRLGGSNPRNLYHLKEALEKRGVSEAIDEYPDEYFSQPLESPLKEFLLSYLGDCETSRVMRIAA